MSTMSGYAANVATMSGHRTTVLRGLTAPLGVAVLHFAAAVASLTLSRWANGLASVWVPNAILLAYLLIAARRQWGAGTLAVMVSGTLANWIGGAPLPLAALFGATNGLEPLAIAAILRAGDRSVDLERIGDLLRFAVAALLLTSASAVVAAGAAAGFYNADYISVALSWLSSSYLGLVIATPLLMVAYKHRHGWRLSPRSAAEAAIVLGSVAVLSWLVLSYGHWPLYFLLQPLVLVATFRLRVVGAASSVLLIAAIGMLTLVLKVGALGPPSLDFGLHMAIFQTFLAVAILTALPVAALLDERDRFSSVLTERERQLGSIVDAVSDVIFRTDVQGRWTYLNPAWEALSGQAVEEAIGRSVLDNVVEEDRDEMYERMRGLTIGLFDSVRHQFRFRNASGEHRWGEVQAHRLLDPSGEMIGAAGIIVDISDRLALAAMTEDARRRAERDAEAALLLAATDELTGLTSRRAFLALLGQHLDSGDAVAVALFDIDHFKRVNDRYGHSVGDEVLQRVAALAESSVRDRDVIGRLGGEEFAVLMPGTTLEQAAAIGERLRKACAEAFHPPGIPVTVSVGVAADASAERESADLLREADAALYRAKFDGRNCLRLAA